jgi:nicotinamide-nucleotide amidase
MDNNGQKISTPANIVTIIRIVLVPVFFIYYLYCFSNATITSFIGAYIKPISAALLFIVISFTDFVDGYLARKRNEVTNFGKFMDPLADKLLVFAAFLAFTENAILPAWVCLLVLFRELLVSGLRMLAATYGLVIAAGWSGKAKTVTQMIAIVLFLLEPSFFALFPQFAMQIHVFNWMVLIVSLILTVVSMIDYFAKSGSFLFGEGKLDLSLDYEELTPNSLDCDVPSYDELYLIANDIVSLASQKHAKLSTAESLTAGMIGSTITSVAGSSSVYNGGAITYATSTKHDVLGVSAKRLETYGPVDPCVAAGMANGAASKFDANITVAVTGIAGPGGEEEGKPVGTVYVALCSQGKIDVYRYLFSGNRNEIRLKTVYCALNLVKDALDAL